MISTRNNQKGSSLLFSLIILSSLAFGVISSYTNTSLATNVTGNLAFKDTSLSASNIGINAAIALLNNMTDFDNNDDHYYALQRKTSDSGLICSLPVTSTQECIRSNTDWGTYLSVGDTKVYYIIDRLCRGLPTTGTCLIDSPSSFTISTNYFYRITVRVSGANNTESFVQLTTTHKS